MPTVICDQGHIGSYRNTRGSRIADMRCSDCGGAVYAASYDREEKMWKRREGRTGARQMVRCAFCGHCRDARAGTIDQITKPVVVFEDCGVREPVTICVGEWLCTYRHHPIIAECLVQDRIRARPKNDYVEQPLCEVFAWIGDYHGGAYWPHSGTPERVLLRHPPNQYGERFIQMYDIKDVEVVNDCPVAV